MVGPAAAACHISSRPWSALGLAVAFSLLATWIGLIVAYDTGWPIGFIISAAVAALYLGARLAGPRLPRRNDTPSVGEPGVDPLDHKSGRRSGNPGTVERACYTGNSAYPSVGCL